MIDEIDKREYFDHLGDDFERFMDDYDVSQRCKLIFDKLLKDVSFENKCALEVGCGTGRISKELVQRLKLTVLDIGENLVKQVSVKYKCNGVVGDACQLPFEDNEFDMVVSSECIEHTPSPKKAVQEMCRVCRPGGIVCLTSPNKLWYPVLWISLKLSIRKFRGIENWLFPYEVSSVMKKCKMQDIRIKGCHLWPFQLKCSRPVLKLFDKSLSGCLYPFMINYGIVGIKEE